MREEFRRALHRLASSSIKQQRCPPLSQWPVPFHSTHIAFAMAPSIYEFDVSFGALEIGTFVSMVCVASSVRFLPPLMTI